MSNAHKPDTCSLHAGRLQTALWSGDIAAAQQELLGASSTVVNSAPSGCTALHIASELGHKDIIGLLLAAGADVRLVDQEGRTALHSACAASHTGVVGALLEHCLATGRAQCVLAMRSSWGNTPLMAAAGHGGAQGGGVAVLHAMLAAGADPNVRGEGGRTALHEAAGSGYAVNLEVLLAAGADMDARDDQGQTAVHHSLLYNVDYDSLSGRRRDMGAKAENEQRRRDERLACLGVLLAAGANASVGGGVFGIEQPMNMVIRSESGDVAAVPRLLAAGARLPASISTTSLAGRMAHRWHLEQVAYMRERSAMQREIEQLRAMTPALQEVIVGLAAGLQSRANI